MIPFPTNPNFPSVTCMHGIKKIIWNGHGYRQSHWVRLTVTVCILQSWALAHFFEVRYPLPTQFFPLDRWRSCVHFLNFPIRSSLKRSSLNQWIAERKRAESLTALYYKIMYLIYNFFKPVLRFRIRIHRIHTQIQIIFFLHFQCDTIRCITN